MAFFRTIRRNQKRVVLFLCCLVFGIFYILQSGFMNSAYGNDTDWFINTRHHELPSNLQLPETHITKTQDIKIQPTRTSKGEQLAQRIQEKCKSYLPNLRQAKTTFPITTNQQHHLLLCPMCKLASTYWTRFFTLLHKHDNHTFITPFDIPLRDAPPTKGRLTVIGGHKTDQYLDYYKFMFVRDPYARILSAYIDKIFAPNPTFWNMISRNEIARFRAKDAPRAPCNSDLSFEEYVRAIITNHRPGHKIGRVDCHDEAFIGACHPCEVEYNFIGKMEDFSIDALHLYTKLQMTDTIKVLDDKGKQLADEDAMMDTINSPFNWKNDIKKCIPWRQALNRVWRKLQIRGVIGKQQLPLNDKEAEDITKEEFVELIKRTQALTSYTERKQQRTDALREIFASVKMDYLQELKLSYKEDFDLFEYSDDPVDIFHVNRSTLVHYGYLDI